LHQTYKSITFANYESTQQHQLHGIYIHYKVKLNLIFTIQEYLSFTLTCQQHVYNL